MSDIDDFTQYFIIGALLAGAYFVVVKGGIPNLSLPNISLPGGGGGTRGAPKGGGGGIKFAAAGDWGNGRNSNWKATMANIKKQHPSVVLIPGDFSYTTPKDFTQVTSQIKSFAKLVGARGNHDTNGNYGSQFDHYSNGVVTIGDTSFMSLDTETGSSTVSWAKANFSKMTGRWKVVQFHKPIFRSKSQHGLDEGKIGALVPEFVKAKIHLVIQAHTHNYERFAPKSGVTYVVAGTGGESFHKFQLKAPGVVKQLDNQYGCLVCTTGATMSCKFITNSGQVFDSWTIG